MLLQKLLNEKVLQSEEKHYPVGAYLFRLGDKPDKIFYLLNGEIQLMNPEQTTHLIAGAGPRLLGVKDLMNEKYSASAKVEKPVNVRVIQSADLLALIQQHPELRLYLIRLLSSGLAEDEPVYE